MGGYRVSSSGRYARADRKRRVEARVRSRYGRVAESGRVHWGVGSEEEEMSCGARVRSGSWVGGGGSGGETQGLRRKVFQVSMLKKSSGMDAPVVRSMKHWPSSGRNV